MGTNKIRSFIKELNDDRDYHPFYCDCRDAYYNKSSNTAVVEPQRVSEKEFLNFYINLLGHLKKNILNSNTSFLHNELKSLIANLKPAVIIKQTQLLILQSLLNYAKKHLNIDSPNISTIVTLKRDKPILTPVDLVKMPVVELLNSILDSELITPNRELSTAGKLGRAALMIYLTVSIGKTEDLLSILESPEDVFYVGGVCYWQSQKQNSSKRFILSDVALMTIQQWHGLQKDKRVKEHMIKSSILVYLNTVSDFNWSDLSIIKLRTLRKIDNVLRYGPVQYRMYLLPSVCQALPEHAFIRLLTNKACKYTNPHTVETSEASVKPLKSWKAVLTDTSVFISIDQTLQELQIIFEHVLFLDESNKNRTDCLTYLTNILKTQKIVKNSCLWLLCSWFFILLKNGGTYKKRLRISTTVDYVKSISRPFLSIFSTSDIKLLSGEDWANKLNETSELFTSAQRKKYVYYFAQFLLDYDLVRDLCLSDIDVVGSASEVDANLISASHIEEVLSYLNQHARESPVHQYAYFLLCFCFFSGLRRNETAKLTWADFSFSQQEPNQDEFDYVQLSVRPNLHRKLKTASGRRELPLDALWPKPSLKKLRTKYQIHKNAKGNKKALLFENAKHINQAYDLITDLLRHYTQDYSLRVHHLRHSFANWSWCRLNPTIIKQGKSQLIIFNNVIFEDEYLERLQDRLSYSNNSRKKMFVLSHLMGHKGVESTLNSYLHLKDILYYLEIKPHFMLTKYFISECVGRATLVDEDQGLSLAERINYFTQDTKRILDIKPAPLNTLLRMPSFFNFELKIYPNLSISSLTWARALNALKVSSVIESSEHFNVPLDELQQLLENAKQINQNYPRTGKKLPLIPKFPRLSHLTCSKALDKQLVISDRVFIFLCNQLDKSIEEERLSLENLRQIMEIIRYAIPGKDYVLRCPNVYISRVFIRFCQLLGLKNRHLKFKFYSADLSEKVSEAVQIKWKRRLAEHEFSHANFEVATQNENKYLGKHDGSGFLEIAVVNNLYKRVQRHQSIFSFFHLVLILSYENKR
ncbi:tyrosine-type recombinase/integrase [Shewanella sp. 10N.286.51.B2]|uniref:tyrosine-type recombinase/integrase n=1 Tax=Shewanella sp. 10N.286.51.B2 TaxID=3229707 RepID=UPI0035501BF2